MTAEQTYEQARYLITIGRFLDAVSHFKQAESEFGQQGQAEGAVVCRSMIAFLYGMAGMHAKANQQIAQALQMLEPITDACTRAHVFACQAELLKAAGRFQEAVEASRMAVAEAEKSAEPLTRGTLLSFLANLLELTGQTEAAERTFNRAALEVQDIDDKCVQCTILYSWSNCLVKLGQNEAAEKALRWAVASADDIDVLTRCYVFASLGLVLCGTEQWDEAEDALRQAAHALEEIEEPMARFLVSRHWAIWNHAVAVGPKALATIRRRSSISWRPFTRIIDRTVSPMS
jgi:tetratricopeptide (TPR) repeat protein